MTYNLEDCSPSFYACDNVNDPDSDFQIYRVLLRGRRYVQNRQAFLLNMYKRIRKTIKKKAKQVYIQGENTYTGIKGNIVCICSIWYYMEKVLICRG